MKVVIEIPEDDYKVFVRQRCNDSTPICRLYKAIRNGVVLPNGHGDLIDRNVCLAMKSRDLVDADGVTMYAVPTGNILRIEAVIPADKGAENEDRD